MESDMQFMTSLFGGSAGTLLNAAFALGIVVVMIVLGLWLLKVLTKAGERLGRASDKRLQVVDTATVGYCVRVHDQRPVLPAYNIRYQSRIYTATAINSLLWHDLAQINYMWHLTVD